MSFVSMICVIGLILVSAPETLDQPRQNELKAASREVADRLRLSHGKDSVWRTEDETM